MLAPIMSLAGPPAELRQPVPIQREAVVLLLAICSVLLGILPLGIPELLRIGQPAFAMLASR